MSNCCNDCNVAAHLTRNNYFNDQPNHKGSFPLDFKPDHYDEGIFESASCCLITIIPRCEGSDELKHELFLRRKRKVSGSAHFIFITPVPPLLFGVSFKVTVYSCQLIKMSAKIYSAMTVPSVIHPCLLGHAVINLIKIAASTFHV